jgi:NHL repeat
LLFYLVVHWLKLHQQDITVNSKDHVYVTDGIHNSRVSIFDSDGKFIKHWESEVKDEGNLLRIMVLLLIQKVMSM